jgi:uncharacterized protein YdeI (YjbR/CyaY-like superfamily)
VWLVTWKKDSKGPYVSYDDVVDELICFGWVDSLPRKLDTRRTMLRISPRAPGSNWSKVNKERVRRLARAGRMEPGGLAAVNAAKANGAWNALDDVENLELPIELEAEFRKHPGSRRFFERFPRSSKRGILEWIINARTAQTRRARIAATAMKAARNLKANHPKGRDAGPKE